MSSNTTIIMQHSQYEKQSRYISVCVCVCVFHVIMHKLLNSCEILQ